MNRQDLPPEDAREAVVRRYGAMVYRLARSQVRRRCDAEDIFQEVFLRYFRAGEEFASEEHRRAWLLRVTANCAKKYWASAWVRHTVPLEEDIEDVAAPGEEGRALWEAVQALPGKYRAVLHLFYYEDLSAEEIGRLLGEKSATVRTRLTRARRLLKQRLEEDGL